MEKIKTETAVTLLPQVQQIRESYLPGITKYEFDTSLEYKVIRFEGFHKHTDGTKPMMPFYRLKGGKVTDPTGRVLEISEIMIPGEAMVPRNEDKIGFDAFGGRERLLELLESVRLASVHDAKIERANAWVFDWTSDFQLYPLVDSNVRGKTSIFHDSEDVSVDIIRERFNWARVVGSNKIEISTKKWFAVLTWEGGNNGN